MSDLLFVELLNCLVITIISECNCYFFLLLCFFMFLLKFLLIWSFHNTSVIILFSLPKTASNYHRDRKTEIKLWVTVALSLVTIFGYGLVIALTHPMWGGGIYLLPWCLLPATEAFSSRERGETAGSGNYKERYEI